MIIKASAWAGADGPMILANFDGTGVKHNILIFFLDIQLYIVIKMAIPPWKRTALSPVPFCQRLWGRQRV